VSDHDPQQKEQQQHQPQLHPQQQPDGAKTEAESVAKEAAEGEQLQPGDLPSKPIELEALLTMLGQAERKVLDGGNLIDLAATATSSLLGLRWLAAAAATAPLQPQNVETDLLSSRPNNRVSSRAGSPCKSPPSLVVTSATPTPTPTTSSSFFLPSSQPRFTSPSSILEDDADFAGQRSGGAPPASTPIQHTSSGAAPIYSAAVAAGYTQDDAMGEATLDPAAASLFGRLPLQPGEVGQLLYGVLPSLTANPP
jgi:hypothetical protein